MIAAPMLAIDESHYGLVEMVLVFGFVLALAVRELVSVRRSLRDVPPPKDESSDPSEGTR